MKTLNIKNTLRNIKIKAKTHTNYIIPFPYESLSKTPFI